MLIVAVLSPGTTPSDATAYHIARFHGEKQHPPAISFQQPQPVKARKKKQSAKLAHSKKTSGTASTMAQSKEKYSTPLLPYCPA
ncbi:MAG: hypothetical protein K8R77_02655, partial [Anaerolineaceae bacterium]|nr:hypothetical protein [Anaerolineaceae bacterium]